MQPNLSPALPGVPTRAAFTGNAAPPATPFTGGRRNEYALGDIARALGIRHLTPKTIITHLRAMAVDCAMPLPKSPRLWKGRIVTGPESIHRNSRWDAELFDAWLESRDRPAAPAITDRAQRQLHAEMERHTFTLINGGKD